MRRPYIILAAVIGLGILAFILFRPYLAVSSTFISLKISGKKTVQDRMNEYSAKVEQRILPYFHKAGISYPPTSLTLLGFKNERILEVYAADKTRTFKLIRSYPILAASGKLGPKLRQGDQQVPEGLYQINFLNPNSLYHLSMRVNYPNDFDKAQAQKDGRTTLGGDIMIHGNSVSIGCLAMGDEAAEDLFIITMLTGIQNTRVILSPVDFRIHSLPIMPKTTPKWVDSIYSAIKEELKKF